jgi:hypothetical protein
LAMVTTGGGQSIQLTGSAGCSLCSADVPLRLQGSSLSGALPIGLFLQGATGTIPISLSGVGGGPTVYTAAAASGSGTGQCPRWQYRELERHRAYRYGRRRWPQREFSRRRHRGSLRPG